MTTHRTAELIGTHLDAAVALAEGFRRDEEDPSAWYPPNDACPVCISAGIGWSPSTDWNQGGPIIERERIVTGYLDDQWRAFTKNGYAAQGFAYSENHYIDVHGYEADGEGETLLIAAMRAYVASKLGETVELP